MAASPRSQRRRETGTVNGPAEELWSCRTCSGGRRSELASNLGTRADPETIYTRKHILTVKAQKIDKLPTDPGSAPDSQFGGGQQMPGDTVWCALEVAR